MRQLIPKSKSKYGQLVSDAIVPTEVKINLFEINYITFSNGQVEEAICLNCIIPPCISYSPKELSTPFLAEMPQMNSLDVCPTDSIKLDENGFPVINSESCFGCGICLKRCDYAAINLNIDFKATIFKGDNDIIQWVDHLENDSYLHRTEIYRNANLDLKPIVFQKEYFDNLYLLVLKNCKATSGFENLFVRNLLLNLGIKNKVRAIGNNDIRFDLLGELESKIIVGEIGLNGFDILEEPRAILDDIAVLSTRYKIELKTILPIIFTLSFPNKRSDVYEVIFDINEVISIKIYSVSIHLLIITNLLRRSINKVGLLELFFVDKDNKSLTQASLSVIPELEEVDPLFGGEYYQAVK